MTPMKASSLPMGTLQRHRVRGQTLAHGLDGVLEVRAGAVHLVDERDARDVILVRLAPDGFRLRLHAGHGVKNRHRAVQHAQRALDFHGEIHVAGRVDNVDQKSTGRCASRTRWSRRR